MAQRGAQIIAVVGSTGLQGGAVTRRLLQDHWRVRALTRNPEGKKARALAQLGAEVVKADLSDPASLERALDGVHGVFSVQNHHISGYEGEVRQGNHVADAAKRVGIAHVVYSAAGVGVGGTGVGSWETKVEVAAHLRALQLPVTILRPMAFMELMTERKFFPPASAWHLMPKLMGATRPVGWLTVEDLAAIVAMAFGDPARFIGPRPPVGQRCPVHRCLPGHLARGDRQPTPAVADAFLAVRAEEGHRGLGRLHRPLLGAGAEVGVASLGHRGCEHSASTSAPARSSATASSAPAYQVSRAKRCADRRFPRSSF